MLWGLIGILTSPVCLGQAECPNVPADVTAENPTQLDAVCLGAEDAVVYLRGLGLTPSHPLVVELVDELPGRVGDTAVGCYLDDQQRILVLTFGEFEKRRSWFNVPIDPSMYRSLVAHEVAHAVADCNFRIPGASIAAKEYVAYVAMFATMQPGLRQRILDANQDKAFDSEQQINTTIYLFDPPRFAVRAYRHHLRAGNGTDFLLRVLRGEALNY